MRDEFRSYNSFNNWWEQSCARNTAAIICIPKSGKAVLAHMKGEKGCFLCEDKGDGVGNGLQRFWLYSTGMLLHMIPMEKLLSGTLFKMENRARKYMVHNKSSTQELKATTNEMDPQERTISQLSRRIIVQTKPMIP
ncbi:uncharacterized protein LOC144657622 isoform X1 [Oculina patagonica]